MATDDGSPRETAGPEPGLAYRVSPRQLPTQPPPGLTTSFRSLRRNNASLAGAKRIELQRERAARPRPRPSWLLWLRRRNV